MIEPAHINTFHHIKHADIVKLPLIYYDQTFLTVVKYPKNVDYTYNAVEDDIYDMNLFYILAINLSPEDCSHLALLDIYSTLETREDIISQLKLVYVEAYSKPSVYGLIDKCRILRAGHVTVHPRETPNKIKRAVINEIPRR